MYCKFCGAPQITQIVISNDENNKAAGVCDNCARFAHTCLTCSFRTMPCAFESYQGPKPKMVMKEIQQGPVIQRINTINPELEEELCNNCVCSGHGASCPKLTKSIPLEFLCDNHKFDF